MGAGGKGGAGGRDAATALALEAVLEAVLEDEAALDEADFDGAALDELAFAVPFDDDAALDVFALTVLVGARTTFSLSETSMSSLPSLPVMVTAGR